MSNNIETEMNKTRLKKSNQNLFIKRIFSVLMVLALFMGTVFVLYDMTEARKYDLKEGDISRYNITASRPIIDEAATARKAEDFERKVQTIYRRSDLLAQESLLRLDNILSRIEFVRSPYWKPLSEANSSKESSESIETKSTSPSEPAQQGSNVESSQTVVSTDESTQPLTSEGGEASSVSETQPIASSVESTTKIVLAPKVKTPSYEELRLCAQALENDNELKSYGLTMTEAQASRFANMPPELFAFFKKNLMSIGEDLMKSSVSQENLNALITERAKTFLESNQSEATNFSLTNKILSLSLRTNQEPDIESTEKARRAKRSEAFADPVMIQAGTRIVDIGDSISPQQYAQLKSLNLLQDYGVDTVQLVAYIFFVVTCFALAAAYLYVFDFEKFMDMNNRIFLYSSLGIILLIAAYFMHYSLYLIPLSFFTILIVTYFGYRAAFVLSSLMVLLLVPLSAYNTTYLFSSLISVAITSLVSGFNIRKNNLGRIIFTSAVSYALGVLLLSFLQKSFSAITLQNAVMAFASGALGAVAAIGIMPLCEVFVSEVSPNRLIGLASPSNPLLKRLLLEAPGTNQHSAMVANLAEAGAEAIGANSFLCRVAAYYHDIGKLTNPKMFTENQDGENPHNNLSPLESYKIITSHVTDGIKLGEKHRLPEPILAIIREHHGNTVLYYFYNKACKEADEKGLPAPSVEDYRYHSQIPSSKESGIVMLADSLEAAMISTKTDSLEGMHALARRILKTKNEQEQLIASGLSYSEVEQVLEAFARVYAGQFHERVKYPEPYKSVSK